MSTDDEVARLLERTREARRRVNTRMAAVGEVGSAIRSPLRERNSSLISDSPTKTTRSPIKTTYSSPVKTSTTFESLSPRRTTRSPIRTWTFKVQRTTEEEPKKVTAFSRVYEDKDGSSRSEESFNREAMEKKTTIIDGDPDSGKSFRKTTITEREETIEKREILHFTEHSKDRISRSPQKILEEFRAKRGNEMRKVKDDDDKAAAKIVIDLSSKNESNTMGSPSRFGSCRDTSVLDEVFSSPARKSRLDLAMSSASKLPPSSKSSESPLRRFALDQEAANEVDAMRRTPNKNKEESRTPNKKKEESDEEDDGSFKSAQRKRLKKLASKFTDYEDEDSEAIKQILAQASATGSPYKRDQTKTVDVDKIINRSAPPMNTVGSSKNDPDFVQSLKAQGFEETASKSKLVYDFKKKPTTVGSPIARDSSPYRPDPMQFIKPAQKSTTATPPASNTPTKSSVTKVPAYRSVSPTRMASPVQRPPSPYKPHPLQFVSPKKINQAPAPPPKPPRTYMDMEQEQEYPEATFRTETVMVVNKQDEAERTDTASRRSILEKRSLFEREPTSPKGEMPDPAMLPLSQRKALFERNKSIPKPIARFGESVTPAMLSKASSNVPASEPAWKRRRDKSPEKQSFYTPSVPRATRDYNETTPAFKKSGVDTKKNLFENNWKDNDIAKASEEDKKRDMELLMNRFRKVSDDVEAEQRRRSRSPSPKRFSPVKSSPAATKKTPSPRRSPERHYPGVNSLKRIKVSPPREGQLYPDLNNIHDERPDTAMSEESSAPSEAPSLGVHIKRAASANKRRSPMKAIAEDTTTTSDEEMECSGLGDEDLDDMLDEALNDSQNAGPTPPKVSRSKSPSTSSAGSWEFTTPVSKVRQSHKQKDFKTPRVDQITDSPQSELPLVETEEGLAPASNLMHTVSFYRKQKPASVAPVVAKIVRNAAPIVEEEGCSSEDDDERIKADLSRRINKLQDEVEEQMQRRAQASKALGICEGQNEFEGSYERVEFERLLLEAHHKHAAATAEINRLKNICARGQYSQFGKSKSKGTISISGVTLPLKNDFVKLMMNPGHGGDDYVHYFVCLVKYRSQVIATQMLSSVDGINRSGQLVFTNLINIKELDFDFQIYLEVYGLQTPKEVLTHEAKYHIRKDKSLFNLGTPLKKLKKMESKFVMTPSSNPVNALNIRKSKFGMVGYTRITIDTLKSKSFSLEKVPQRSPLEGSMFMKLNVHSESTVEERGFLTKFTDNNGFGDWVRRWCVLRDNTLFFWKYPEDEQKRRAPLESESIALHNCFSENVTLAPREICARMNTFMLESRRHIQSGDREALNMHVDRKSGYTTTRHLLMADTRDERLHWCRVLNVALENLRAWDPTSMRPRANSTSTTTSTETADAISNASTDIW